MAGENLGGRIAAYGAWRDGVSDALRRYWAWVEEAGACDDAGRGRVDRLVERLRQDRLSIAFVAEFSRGKSELINALFFAGYGRRILPSTAGRTTMCPTELLYDASRPPSIRLLPIESRLVDASLAELRDTRQAWHEIRIRPGDAQNLAAAFAAVRETSCVTIERAAELGLYSPDDPDAGSRPNVDGTVEIPRWRHAIVNLPDPLLMSGLVVIDTPGLNAIGSEPELTLNLIPSADAVLFVLAADAGVTRSDVEVWRDHVGPSHGSGRYVVLNKIDGLWDDLRDPAQIDDEIDRQVESVAQTLEVDAARVFPVSAQKGLVAKVRGDEALLARSRLPSLEAALSTAVVPRQRELLAERVGSEFDALHAQVASLLATRRRALAEQMVELNGLRGRNREVVEVMAARVSGERAEFDRSLRQLKALRIVVARHSRAIFGAIGVGALKRHVRASREQMRASHFSLGLRDGMSALLACARADLSQVALSIDEVNALMSAMYRSFGAEHGLTLDAPIAYSMRHSLEELDRIESLHRREFGPMSLVTTEKWALMRRFFESVAARVREVYDLANREIEGWLREVIAPIEGQLRERESELRGRIESLQRMLEATQSLDDRIGELGESRALVEQQVAAGTELAGALHAALASADAAVDDVQFAPA